MKSSKVLRKLRSKVRDRTVFLSEQNLNILFNEQIQSRFFFFKKGKMKPILNLCVVNRKARVVREPDVRSLSLVDLNSGIRKRCLRLNDTLDYRVLTLRSLNKFSQRREKYKVIRPLLDFKRESITMVCKDFKMPVYPDQTNNTVHYSRNRIRKQIIPSIKYFLNPQLENSLFKMSELLNKEQFFLYSVLRNTSTNVRL